jgi:hypothetical protein
LRKNRSGCRWRRSAAIGIVVLLSGCGAQATPHRGHSRLQSIIEDEGFLRADPAAALAAYSRLGVDRVRVYVRWDAIAPDPTSSVRPAFDAADPAAYPAGSWAPYDTIVRDAAKAGIGLDLTIGAPAPDWAGTPGAPRQEANPGDWRPSAADFGAFVHALGERYGGHYMPAGASTPLPRVDFWAIWNEPNYGPYLAPQAIDHSTVEVAPRLYRGLLDAAWTALGVTGHRPRTDTILIGETAPRGLSGPNLPGNFSGTMPLRFVRGLYCVGPDLRPLRGLAASVRGCPPDAAASARFPAEHPALFESGGFADHPYPDQLAPNVRTPLEPDYADFAALGNLERTLDRAAAVYGRHPRLPIYSTEFGYRTRPPSASFGLPLAQAAAYLNQSEYLSWRDRRIRSYDQYLLNDPSPAAGSDFVTGLRFSSGRPKPYVYAAYRMPLWLPVTRFARGTALEIWGCVRPAPRLARSRHRTESVAIQFARPGARYETVRRITLSDPHGYFDTHVSFAGAGTVRLAWSGSGPTLHSRAQAITRSR